MTRLPRDVSGETLSRALGRVGYSVVRQSGSHIRLTTSTPPEHHLTIPRHDALRVGTLSAILSDVAEHLEMSRDALIDRLFG